MDGGKVLAELKNFLDEDGRLIQFPAKRKMKRVALAYLAEKFEPEKRYTEKEVNELLLSWHTFGDPATLRRELYNARFLGRDAGGAIYWLEKVEEEISVGYVETEEELKTVLRLCYRLLAPELMVTLSEERDDSEDVITEEIKNGDVVTSEIFENIYAYAAWRERMEKYSRLLVYAKKDGEIVSAVLGRPESEESLVCGMVACDEKFRLRGITRMLMEKFVKNAHEMGFRYITLGADGDAEGFYEKCGFHVIFEVHGQKIYQRMLE